MNESVTQSELTKEKKKFGHRLKKLNKKVKDRVEMRKGQVKDLIGKKREDRLDSQREKN